jgi:hypothetical protein
VVDVDEGNNEGVCDDVLGYGKNRNNIYVLKDKPELMWVRSDKELDKR